MIEKPRARKSPHPTTVLLAVAPAPLMRVVKHLLGYRANLEVVARVDKRNRLAQAAARSLPHIAIVSERLAGEELRQALAQVRQASPRTRLIVIRAGWEFDTANRDWGADAYVRESALVRRLNSLLARLSAPRPPAPSTERTSECRAPSRRPIRSARPASRRVTRSATSSVY